MICKLPGQPNFLYILKTPDGRFFQKVLKWILDAPLISVQTNIIKSKKIHLSCLIFVYLGHFRPHKISLILLSQDLIDESISPLPKPSPYLLKTQLQLLFQKEEKNKIKNKMIKK